jgi:membrane-associated HD superfamily phosphohydrolase
MKALQQARCNYLQKNIATIFAFLKHSLLIISCFVFRGFNLPLKRKESKMRLLLLLNTLCLLAAVTYASKDEKNKDIGTVIGIDLGTTYSW